MPSDLSSPRLDDRSFTLLDDMNNLGLRKRIFGEVDVFQFDDTQMIPLGNTREFGEATFDWSTEADGWTWARVAVWDVAGNGAFVNPVWKTE